MSGLRGKRTRVDVEFPATSVPEFAAVVDSVKKTKLKAANKNFLKRMSASKIDGTCSIARFVTVQRNIKPEEVEPDTTELENWRCSMCNTDLVYIRKDAQRVCPSCGEASFFQEMTRHDIISQGYCAATSYLYKRHNHFKTCLKRTQGRETTSISPEVIELVKNELTKMRIYDMDEVDHFVVKGILKKLRQNKYYNNSVQITTIVTGKVSPQMSREQEDCLMQMFERIQKPFEKIIAEKSRQNMLSYSFLIHKFLQIMNWDEFLPYFPLLVSADKIQVQDAIWKELCNEVGFEYLSAGGTRHMTLLIIASASLGSIEDALATTVSMLAMLTVGTTPLSDKHAAGGRQVMLLSDRREHLRAVHAELMVVKGDSYTTSFMVAGVSAEAMLLAAKAAVIFATYAYASEGVDVPTLDTVVFATPRVDVIQTTGRILRKHKDKKRPLVVDFIDVFSVFKNQFSKRLRYYKKLGARVTHMDQYLNPYDVKHYAPSAENQAADKASEILFIVFKSVLSEFGVKISDLAGGTTDSGSDVKAMCVNFLLRQHKVSWDWCVCHLADRAAEHAFGTSADPQKSKNKDARAVVQLVIKAASKVNQSHVFKQKLDEAQLEMTGEVLKIRKHAPQRWLSLVHVMERIIRLWHVFRKVYANDGVEFPLDKGDNKDDILQLYSLLQPLAAITRDGQYGAVPMSAEMHMAFAELKQEVLDTTKPLRVFDIPPTPDSPAALQSDEEFPVTGKTAKKPLPHKLVEPAALRPVAAKTRGLLGEALVEKLYGRVWDEDRADPSPFRNAAVLLTPSYKDSKFLDAYALTEGDAQHLSESKAHLAPTLDDEVQSALDASWEDIRTRASDAARKKHAEAATVTDGQPPLKRFCTPNGAAKPRFASLARSRTSHQSADESDGDSALAKR
eukprot:g15647.t1